MLQEHQQLKVNLNIMLSFGGGTGESDTTSGRIFVSPTPNTTYRFRVHFNKMPDTIRVWQ